jgi:type II secretory pathway pseudopilin PulG
MRNRTLLFIFLSAALVACSGVGSNADDRSAVDIDAWNGELPISAPWLRDRLPAGALTYERIPHPLGLMAIPKGNVLDTALGSEANIQNLIRLQQGLAENFAVGIPPMRLIDALRSPIEIAGIGAPPLTSVILAATLSFRSDADFEAYVGELSQLSQGAVSLAAPLDSDGFAQLMPPPGVPVQIFVNFDEATGRLALYGGIAADRTSFQRLLGSDAVDHPMHAIEAEIDDSGQGLFAWVDAAQALQAGAAFLPPEAVQTIGALQIRSLGLGAGVANGKGRLKLLIDAGTGNPNRPLPVVSNRITATSVGDTRHLFLLSIPSAAEFTRLEGLVLSNFPAETANAWAQIKAGFSESTGTSIEEILSAIGPELITISDRVGDYFALHVNDQDLFDNVLERWTSNAGVTLNAREVEGQTIRSIELPASFGVPQAADMPPQAAAVVEMVSRMRTRFYWVADGDYLYVAGTPQLLIDRVAIGADASVAEWLDDTQRFDVSSSLLAMTGSAERLPQMMYNGYVGMMQTFADLAGVDYDVWSMPTANQLGLPERGTLGASINLGEPYISFELSYESHPAELLVGTGGMAAVAAVGIAAAIAIPAYQDYTIRAQVSEGLNLAATARVAVAESYLANGEAPANRAAAGMTPDASDSQGRYVQGIDIVDGEIFVQYGNAANGQIAGRTLVLTPFTSPDGSIVWRCGFGGLPGDLAALGGDTRDGTTMAPQYLPSACRV